MRLMYGAPPIDKSPRIPLAPLPIDDPPPYAADVETAAIDALGKLSPEQASRVIAWACSRFGVPGPIIDALAMSYVRTEKAAKQKPAKRKAKR